MNEHIRRGEARAASLRAPINHCNNRPISRYLQTREHVYRVLRATPSVLTHLDSSTFARPFGDIKSSVKSKLRQLREQDVGLVDAHRRTRTHTHTYTRAHARTHRPTASPVAAHGNVAVALDTLGRPLRDVIILCSCVRPFTCTSHTQAQPGPPPPSPRPTAVSPSVDPVSPPPRASPPRRPSLARQRYGLARCEAMPCRHLFAFSNAIESSFDSPVAPPIELFCLLTPTSSLASIPSFYSHMMCSGQIPQSCLGSRSLYLARSVWGGSPGAYCVQKKEGSHKAGRAQVSDVFKTVSLYYLRAPILFFLFLFFRPNMRHVHVVFFSSSLLGLR
ncbi:unnamed protein product [Danaus chrysippus]|uniref:(African queen) hypothetical protein n=1 Tax=Danaus chrysippus TaxID=151541 RepID=A0A8J2W0V3_9NEOP|nr:unnamed protein product [Danaus chrysippus]